MWKSFQCLLIGLLAGVLAACGGSPASPTAQPTAVPPTEASAPVLGETYTSADGRWTVSYPTGWVVSDSIANIILLASSQATTDKTFSGAAFNAGEAAVQFGLNTRNNRDEEITAHVSSFAGGIGIPLGDAAALTIDERPAARVDGSNDNRHLMVISTLFDDAVDVAVGTGDTYVDAVTYTNPGEFAQMEPTLLAIIESIHFSSN